jgi:hypothetical protein
MTKQILTVEGVAVAVVTHNEEDYISLTDMVRESESGSSFIENWLRNKNTLEFLSVWEDMYNPTFNSLEFEGIKSEAGLNRFAISVKQWIAKTNAIGLIAKAGRYGGTYAHRDIAFEFASWISPKFKLYLIKEFQRLKNDESQAKALEWNLSRNLARINYKIHTDAIKENILPKALTALEASYAYASEADILNMALFGMTAKQWRESNVGQEGNIRDHAEIEQLVVLSNLESLNAELIRQKIPQSDRLRSLNTTAIAQLRSLLNSRVLKKLN